MLVQGLIGRPEEPHALTFHVVLQALDLCEHCLRYADLEFPGEPGWVENGHHRSRRQNRAINSAGCYLTTSQHPIAGPLEGDREESEYQNERIATTLRSQLTNVQAQPASETRVSGFSGKKIEGAASEISYTGKDGVAYKGWYWSRVFGKIKTPVLLQSTYACPVQAYSAAELTSIINGKLSILSTASEDFDG